MHHDIFFLYTMCILLTKLDGGSQVSPLVFIALNTYNWEGQNKQWKTLNQYYQQGVEMQKIKKQKAISISPSH